MSDKEPLEKYLALMKSEPGLFADMGPGAYRLIVEREAIVRAQLQVKASRAKEGISSSDVRVGVLADDPYLKVMRDAVIFPDGETGIYNRLFVPRGVVVLPVMNGCLLLIERYRHGIRRFCLEAPRGSLQGDEAAETQAARELREEIGAELVQMVDLGEIHSSSGCSNEQHRLYLAYISSIGELDRHEAITRVRALSVSEFEQGSQDGLITDAPTLVAFLKARLRKLL